MYAYRCSRCRTRNRFKRRVEDYVRKKTCKSCGYARFYWDKERNARAPGCHCQGYWFPHRPGSRHCHQNPLWPVWETLRQGGSWLDACAAHFEITVLEHYDERA